MATNAAAGQGYRTWLEQEIASPEEAIANGLWRYANPPDVTILAGLRRALAEHDGLIGMRTKIHSRHPDALQRCDYVVELIDYILAQPFPSEVPNGR